MYHPQQTTVPAPAAPPTNAELKNQIKQSILAAREARREAGQAGTLQNEGSGPDAIPPQAVDISIAFFIMCAVIVIGWPIARALGKRLERHADAPVVNVRMAEQLQHIEQAVDAMSIEIERISESQRFMTKLQSAQKAELKGLSG